MRVMAASVETKTVESRFNRGLEISSPGFVKNVRNQGGITVFLALQEMLAEHKTMTIP
jgi:hypothetical protein